MNVDVREGWSSHVSWHRLASQGLRSAGVHFEWPKWTKSHLGALPLRTPLGSVALGCWKNPKRPRGKLIPSAATSAAAHCPSVEGICPRSAGPAIGSDCQPTPNPDAVAKEALRFYTGSMSGSGARRTDNPPYLSVGGGCSSAMQGDLRGVPRGERLRRFFPRFLIVEKSGLAERPLCQSGQGGEEKIHTGACNLWSGMVYCYRK